MNFIRNIVSHVSSKLDVIADDRDASISRSPRTSALHVPHVLLDPAVAVEAALGQTWTKLQESATHEGFQRDLWQQFLQQIINAYQHWQPVDLQRSSWEQLNTATLDEPSAQMVSLESGSLMGSKVHVRGCNAGHPRDFIQALVSALQQLPNDLPGILRGEAARPKGTDTSAFLQLLEVAAILSRSHLNRVVFASLGGITALSKLLKAAVMHLNTLGAILGAEPQLAQGTSQLGFLQCVLLLLGSILDNITEGEYRYVCGMADGAGAQGHAADARRADAEAMNRALKPLIEEGVLIHMVELLRVLRLLKARGGQSEAVHKVQETALGSLRLAIAHSPTAQIAFRNAGGLQVLVDLVGWPAGASLQSSSAKDAPGSSRELQYCSGGLAADKQELQAQLLALSVLGEAIRHNRTNLKAAKEAGAFFRITQLLHWTTIAFCTEHLSPPHKSPLPTPPSPTSPLHPKLSPPPPPILPPEDPSEDPDELPHANPMNQIPSPSDLPLLPGTHSVTPPPTPTNSCALPPPPHTIHPTSSPPASHPHSPRSPSTHTPTPTRSKPSSPPPITTPGSHKLSPLHPMRSPTPSTPPSSIKSNFTLEAGAAAAATAAATAATTSPPSPFPPSHPSPQPADPSRTIEGYPNPVLAHLLSIMEQWMNLTDAQAHADDAAPLGTTLADSLTKELLESILNAFTPGAASVSAALQPSHSSQLHVGCLELLSARPPILQLHALATLFHVLRARPAFIRWLRKLQVWEVLYGPYFFFYGQPTDPDGQYRSTAEEPSGVVSKLQEWVVELTEVAASSRGSQTNEPECLKMLQLLETAAAGDWRTLLLIAPCLDRLLWGIPEPTIQVCEKRDALSYLGRSIQVQQQRASEEHPDKRRPRPDPKTVLAARTAVLNLLGTMFELSEGLRRRAVRGWECVATLFGVLWEPPLRSASLRLLVKLMGLPALSEDDRLAKEMMFTKFVEALPRAKGQWREDRLVLLLALLHALPSILQHDRVHNQALLRNADALAQVVALLDEDYPPELAAPLLLHVLRSLTILLAGNESSRLKFKNEVGYDTLLRAVLRATGQLPPSKEVLLSVLGLVLEQDYHPDVKTQVVANPDAAAVHLQLLRKCEEDLQVWGLALWGNLASQGLANLAALQRAGANGLLVSWLAASTSSPSLQSAVANLLQVTGAYSISGKDLRAILALLKPQSGRAPHHAGTVLAMLRAMARHEGPSAFFDFSAPTAGIVRVDSMRWPSKGYTFATWLRVEDSSSVAPFDSQSLYSFLSRRGASTVGVAARLKDGHLGIRFIGEKKTHEVLLKFVFEPRKWYHVAICHSSGSLALSSPQVRVYVDGNLQASAKLKYPHKLDCMTAITFAAAVRAEDSGLHTTSAATSPTAASPRSMHAASQLPIGAFTGQMGCLYLLEDILTPLQVRMLYSLGPEYQGSFLPAEYSPTLSQASAAAAALLEGKDALGGRLLAGYCPQAAAGRMLLDMAALSGSRSAASSPSEQQQLGTAEVLQGTSLCLTCQLHDILNCVGGVKVLLPLVAQLDAAIAPPTPPPSPSTTPPTTPPAKRASRSGDVMGLLEGVLRNSPAALQSCQLLGGFGLVAHLLQQQHPRHLNMQLLEVLEAMWGWAGRMPAVASPLLEHLVCNLGLWAGAEAFVQRRHQALLEKLIREDPTTLNQVLTIPRVLAAVRAHYWATQTADSSKPAAGGGLPAEELRTLRRGLLRIASVLACTSLQPQKPAGSHLVVRDIQSFAAFAADCGDAATQEDVAEELCTLLQPASPVLATVASMLASQGGFLLLLPLLQREQAPLRHLGLRVLQLLLAALSGSTQPLSAAILSSLTSAFSGGEEERAEGLWATVSDTLLMFPLTKEVRLVLLDIMCPPTRPAPTPLHRLAGAPSAQAQRAITVPQVMSTLCRLLLACDDATERLALLESLVTLLDGSRTNLEAITQLAGWQEWLLDLLLDGSPCNATPSRPSSLQPSPRDRPPAGASAAAGTCSASSTAEDPANGEGRVGTQEAGRDDGLGDEALRRTGLNGGVGEAGGKVMVERKVFQWGGMEAQRVRRLLQVLHVHCALHQQGGWRQLQRTACYIRRYSERGVVDGWGLVHEVLGDVVEGVLAAQEAATTDSWTLVPALSVPPARTNVSELLGLVDALLAGALVPPTPDFIPPSTTALPWAKGSPNPPLDLNEDAWAALGISPRHAGPPSIYTPSCWRLYLKSWALIKVLQGATDALPLPPKLQGVINRGGMALQEGSVSLRALLGPKDSSSTTSPDPSTTAMATEAVMQTCAFDRLPRLGLRLLLLHMQHAPLQQLRQLIDAATVLPRMLEAAGPAAWDRVHLSLMAAMRCKNLLHPRNLSTSPLSSFLLQPGDGSTARFELSCRVVADLVVGLKGPLLLSLRDPSSPTPPPPTNWDELTAGGMVQVDRVVRCARVEVLHAAQLGQVVQAATGALEAAQDDAHRLERQRLRAVGAASQDAVMTTCSADHAVRAAIQSVVDEQRQVAARKWKDLHRALTSERGVWAAPDLGTMHWKLDPHEDRTRRRMKLKRNYRFVAYSDVPRGQSPAPKTAVDPSIMPASPSVLHGANRNAALENLEDEGEGPEGDEVSRASTPGGELAAGTSVGGDVDGQDMVAVEVEGEGEGEGERSTSPEPRGWDGEPREVILQERVLLSMPCQLITPKAVLEGRLELTSNHLHFCGEVPPPPPPAAGPGSKGNGTSSSPEPQQTAQQRRRHKRWSLRRIREIHHSRYLLQPSALELFPSNSPPVLLNFPSKSSAKDLARRVTEIYPQVVFMDRGRKIEAALKLQQRWQRHEISNFDYLMQINTLAGRTYNDLNQYPVLPWVIADYTSPVLDLASPSTFRDLSKPVGVQSDKRREFYEARYVSMKADGEMPPFHYGSHYSSSAIVLFYLLRLEPFTALNRQLQGGRFDHADRLFHSVAGTWRNAQESSADVKELLPEFFCQPEFLLNSNAFNLGSKQDGERLGDVQLPPWAQGSPEEFVRIQREALESDYVSEHLHLWIDLIFGPKQRGRAAEEACNVFYYLTYEGAVDLTSITDPLERAAIEDQIRHFGQTPPQLFRRRHPKRSSAPPPASRPLLNAPEAVRLVSITAPSAAAAAASGGRAYPVARISVGDGRVVVVTADRVVSSHRWISPRSDLGSFAFSMAGENPFSVEPDPLPPRSLGSHGDAGVQASSDAYCIIPGSRVVASCGYWDNSVKLNSWEDGRLLQSVVHHSDLVTCLAASPCCSVLATGSRDTTIAIWSLSTTTSRGKGSRPLLSAQPVAVLDGHDDSVVALALSTSLDLIISASASGVLLFHTLSRGEYVRTLPLPGGAAPAVVVLAEEAGLLAVHSHCDLAIHLYTINGRHVASAECGERLRAMQLSVDGRQLIMGGDKGLVEVRWLHSLQVVQRYEDAAQAASMGRPLSITSLAATGEDCLLAGTSDGCVLLLAPDSRRLRSCHKLNLATPLLRR